MAMPSPAFTCLRHDWTMLPWILSGLAGHFLLEWQQIRLLQWEAWNLLWGKTKAVQEMTFTLPLAKCVFKTHGIERCLLAIPRGHDWSLSRMLKRSDVDQCHEDSSILPTCGVSSLLWNVIDLLLVQVPSDQDTPFNEKVITNPQWAIIAQRCENDRLCKGVLDAWAAFKSLGVKSGHTS